MTKRRRFSADFKARAFDGAETVDFLFGQRFGLRNFSNFEVRQVNGHEIVKHRFAPATIQLVRQRTKVICVLRSGVRYVQDEEAPLVKASRHYPTRVARHNQVANISHSLRRSGTWPRRAKLAQLSTL